MLLILDDINKKHLELLKTTDVKVVKEFCRISVDHLFKGSNSKVYQSAAQRLGVPTELVQNAISGITLLFMEAAKIMASELEFRDSILVLGFSGESMEELVTCYLDNYQELRKMLSSIDMGIPHYKNLEWRLDIQIASRALRRPLEPSLLLRLQLEAGGTEESHVLEADPSNVLHMTEALEAALKEAKSQHCRRVTRSLK